MDEWTQVDAERIADELLDVAMKDIYPYRQGTPTETLLLASIAASNLAIAKSQPKRRKS